MTEDEALAGLRAIRHQLLACFRVLGGARIYLEDDGEPVAVIVPAEWHEQAAYAWAMQGNTAALTEAGYAP